MSGLKLGVIGSRKWQNQKLIFQYLDRESDKISEIVSGDAISGPDKMGARWGRKNNKIVTEFPPDTKRKHPYHYRNRLIAEYCDILVAFWDGKSSGTKYTMDYATRLGKTVVVVKNGQKVSDIPNIQY